MFVLPHVQYGVLLDDGDSMDYYETLNEAWDARGTWGGIAVVKIAMSEIECICYSTASSRCQIHGY